MTTGFEGIELIVHGFLVEREHLGPGERPDPRRSLIGSGVIDSLAVLDLIGFLEERFGISFEPDDLTGENFDSIATIARLVAVRLPASAAAC
ncbi:MAG TPA: acyl carrier protein [Arenibaculum sp.]|nr:acyl carrier protein [Arenibaculum sp.]